MKIKVLTYNIHKGFSIGNRRFVLEEIKSQLKTLNVDLVFLQEVQGQHLLNEEKIDNWPMESQFEYLADTVWPHFAYGKNAIYTNKHHGNAILSKFPFSEWENINVAYSQKASRSLLYGTINIPHLDQNIHVVCLHLGLTGFERKKQIHTLNQHLHQAKEKNIPIIIGGDFNDWSGKEVDALLDNSLDLKEAFFQTHHRYARTFPSFFPFLKVDRIYFHGLKTLSCHCLNEPPWNRLSDHVPLLAEFEI